MKPLCLEVGFEQHFVINNTSHLLLDDGLVPIASTTKTIFPVSTIRLLHKAYFDARALILFSLELVFWTADPTRIKMMKSWFGDAGSWNRALMGSLFCLQAFVIISFPVVVHTHTFHFDNPITPKVAASIGFVATFVFYISRVYIIEAIDGNI